MTVPKQPRHRFSYVDLDFRPDASGWRAVYLTEEDPGWFDQPVAGWLVQAETRWCTITCQDDDDRPLIERPRRVVAGVVDWTGVEAAQEAGNFHRLIPPGGSDPSADEIAQARRDASRAAS